MCKGQRKALQGGKAEPLPELLACVLVCMGSRAFPGLACMLPAVRLLCLRYRSPWAQYLASDMARCVNVGALAAAVSACLEKHAYLSSMRGVLLSMHAAPCLHA